MAIKLIPSDSSSDLLLLRSTREHLEKTTGCGSYAGKTWKSWSKCSKDEKWAIVAKIALAIFITAILATACVFTGMAALGCFAALAILASSTSYASVGAIFGASAGLGIGALASPWLAIRNKMHKYNKKNNAKQTLKYAASVCGLTTLSAGVCAGVGAGTFVGLGIGVKTLLGINFKALLPNLSMPKVVIPSTFPA